MGKPKGYDIPNPETKPPESKKEQHKRKEREQKFRDAVFAYALEQVQSRHEHAPRHVTFDDTRRKGGRHTRKQRIVSEAAEE